MAKQRLDSWKSIAEYLERSPRTVQRWHEYHALPVHHFGGAKGSVFAYAEEIDRWLMTLAAETRLQEPALDDGLRESRSRSMALVERAAELWETRSEESVNLIAGLQRKAIELDPGNGRALAGLANTMIWAALQGTMDGSVAYPSAAEALRRAAQLGKDEPETVCGAAWLDLLEERKWRQARRGFEAVLSRYPEHPFSMSGLSLVHVAEGDLAGASKWAWDAWHTNTLVGAQGTLLCWVRYLAGEYEAALEMASQLRMGGGHGANAGMVEVLALLRSAQVAEQMERIEGIAGEFSQNQTLQGALGYAYARTKQTGKAWEILTWMEQMQAQRKRRDAYGLALIHLGLGNEQEAVRWLEQSYAEGSLWSLGFRSDPMLKVLRGDPRWEMLVRRIGAASASGGAVPLDFMAKAI